MVRQVRATYAKGLRRRRARPGDQWHLDEVFIKINGKIRYLWCAKYLNNRAENSHQPTRQRERAMKRFTSPGHAQRFLPAFSVISPHFRPRRHLLHAEEYHSEMVNRFSTWNDITRLITAA